MSGTRPDVLTLGSRITGKRLPSDVGISGNVVTLERLDWSHSQGGHMDAVELEVWTTPDFVEYETPMEVTAYAARMED